MKNIRGRKNGTLIMLFSIACLCLLYATYILISPEDQKETNYTFRKAVRFDTKASMPSTTGERGLLTNSSRSKYERVNIKMKTSVPDLTLKASRPHNKTIKGEGINKRGYISISGGRSTPNYAYAKKEYVGAQNIGVTNFNQMKSPVSDNTTFQSAEEGSATRAPSMPNSDPYYAPPLDGELYVLLLMAGIFTLYIKMRSSKMPKQSKKL